MNPEQRLNYLEWLRDELETSDGLETITETAGATFVALLDLPGMQEAYDKAMALEPVESPTSILAREISADPTIPDPYDLQ